MREFTDQELIRRDKAKKLSELGIDPFGSRFERDAWSQEIKDKLVANREFTRALNIGGVPMLIVNGNIHPGALFGDELNEVVAESAK